MSIDDYELDESDEPDEAELARAAEYGERTSAEIHRWLRNPPEDAVAVCCLPCWTRHRRVTPLGYVCLGVDFDGEPMAWYPCVRRARDRGGRRTTTRQMMRGGGIESRPVQGIRDEQWARREFVGRQQTEGVIDVHCRQCPRRFISKVGRLCRQVTGIPPGGTYYV
ncbi:MAG: hypothetical protein ACXV5Q_14600 [Frankiaceae bacterium]